MSQWCVPADVLKAEAEEKKTKGKKGGQQKLGFGKANKPVKYMWEGVLDGVARHIACDNQVSHVWQESIESSDQHA